MVFEVHLSIAEYAECEGFEPWLGVDVLEGRIITNREFIRRSHPQGEDNPCDWDERDFHSGGVGVDIRVKMWEVVTRERRIFNHQQVEYKFIYVLGVTSTRMKT
jgi:hypothetical protein